MSSFLDRFSNEQSEMEFFRTQRAELQQVSSRYSTLLELARSVDSTIQCPRCASRKVVYRYQQTRSADEGMTCICSCSQCRHSFTIRS